MVLDGVGAYRIAQVYENFFLELILVIQAST